MTFFAGSSVNAQIDSLNILFIGNSYTHNNDMPKLFEKIATSQGIRLNVEMSAESNHTFEMHSKRTKMYRTITQKKWDYVVLQGFSRELAHDTSTIDTSSVPYLSQILDSIYANHSNTKVLLYQTWGYRNGAPHLDYANSFEKMTQAIEKGYQYIAQKFNLSVVPVGNIWKEVRNNSRINLYQDDGQHPSVFGSYLVASAFFTSIFKASLNENSYIPNKRARKKFNLIQTISFEYLLNNFESNYLSNESIAVVLKGKNGKTNLKATPLFTKKVEQIKWDLGDGKQKTIQSIEPLEHNYQLDGWVPLSAKVYFSDDTSLNRVRLLYVGQKSANMKNKRKQNKIFVIQRKRETIESEKFD